jgi:protein-tyrosine phosphatase
VSGPRVMQFEQCFNMRDLGGLSTRDGHLLPHGRIYRSDDPFLISARDLDTFRELRITSVVDLRMAEEIAERGSATWQRLAVEHFAVPLVEGLPAMEDHTRYVDPDWVADLYLEMLVHGRSRHQRLWQALAHASPGRTVIHCASGRDRTAIVVALLLGFLGVDDDQIVEDYTISAVGMERMLNWLDANHPEKAEAVTGNRAAMVFTPPETMQLFLAGFRSRYGTFEAYADDLGVTDDVAVLRRTLLET